MVLWILIHVGRTPCMGDHPCSKTATYTGQHERRCEAHRHPCLEWDSSPRSQSQWEKKFHALDRATTVITLPFIPRCFLPELPVLMKERFPYKIPKSIFDFKESRPWACRVHSKSFQKLSRKINRNTKPTT
jgi:hypothetical protein